MGTARGESKGDRRGKEQAAVLIGLGANLPSPKHGPPVSTLEAALVALAARGIEIRGRSRWWESAPLPASDQPWYVNGVAEIGTILGPEALLAALLEIEVEFGRVRSVPNAPRLLDLDLLAYGDIVRKGPIPPLLPHPRLAERGFVLRPLAELKAAWRHPQTGLSLPQMIAELPPGQIVRPLPHSAPSI